MTIQTMLLLLASFFLGAIFTEIRWILRFRRFQGQLDLREVINSHESPPMVETAERMVSGEVQLTDLRTLHDQLTAEGAGTLPTPASTVRVSGASPGIQRAAE